MDLSFRDERGSAGFRCCFDSLREDFSLPEGRVFHVRKQVRAAQFGRILSVGLESVFVRRGFITLFVIIEAMTRPSPTIAFQAQSPRLAVCRAARPARAGEGAVVSVKELIRV